MAKVWKKLQRADSDFAGNVTGQVGGTNASDVKDGAVAGSAAKTITDAAFDSNTKLKTANAQDGMINSNTTKSDVGLANVENKSSSTIRGEITVSNITTDAGLGKGDIGLSNVENKSQATILSGNLTGSVDGTAVATVKSGAAAGATANQDSTSTILAGNLTGSVDGTAVATVKSGAASGATAIGAFDTSGSSPIIKVANAPASLKNASISIGSDGSLSGAGGGQVTASGVGAIKTDASNAPNSLKNNQISISAAGVLSGAGGGTVTASGVGAIKTDGTNAPSSLTNSSITVSSSGGTVTLNNAGGGSFGKSDVGLGSVINQAVTVASGKIKLDGTAQTLDADSVGGDSKDTIKAAAVSTAETNIIGGAPGALNTLAELASSLGNDANFATSTTNALATKGKAPITLTAEDLDGDSAFDNDPSSEAEGQIGVFGGQQYVVVDI